MKSIFNCEFLTVSNLKTKILEHLVPCQPFCIEYIIQPGTSSKWSAEDTNFTPEGLLNCNAKAFDIEVDVIDITPFKQIQRLNEVSKSVSMLQDSIDSKIPRYTFMVNKLNELFFANTEKESTDISTVDELLQISGLTHDVLTLMDPSVIIRHRDMVEKFDAISQGRLEVKAQLAKENDASNERYVQLGLRDQLKAKVESTFDQTFSTTNKKEESPAVDERHPNSLAEAKIESKSSDDHQ